MEETVIFRCGWCGWPCDENGKAFEISYEEAEKISRNKNATVHLLNGSCCPNGDGTY